MLRGREHDARVLGVAAAVGVVEGREELALPQQHLAGRLAHRAPTPASPSARVPRTAGAAVEATMWYGLLRVQRAGDRRRRCARRSPAPSASPAASCRPPRPCTAPARYSSSGSSLITASPSPARTISSAPGYSRPLKRRTGCSPAASRRPSARAARPPRPRRRAALPRDAEPRRRIRHRARRPARSLDLDAARRPARRRGRPRRWPPGCRPRPPPDAAPSSRASATSAPTVRTRDDISAGRTARRAASGRRETRRRGGEREVEASSSRARRGCRRAAVRAMAPSPRSAPQRAGPIPGR